MILVNILTIKVIIKLAILWWKFSNLLDDLEKNIEKMNVVGLKPGYDYSELDENGSRIGL